MRFDKWWEKHRFEAATSMGYYLWEDERVKRWAKKAWNAAVRNCKRKAKMEKESSFRR